MNQLLYSKSYYPQQLDNISTNYKIYNYYIDFQSNKQSQTINTLNSNIKSYECTKKNTNNQYIAIKLPMVFNNKDLSQSLNIEQNYYSLDLLNKTKLLNLIHPEDIFYEENCTFLTQPIHLNEFLLNKCYKILSKDEIFFIICQLSITLQEFNRRKFPQYNLKLDTIYLIENVIFLSILHFDLLNNQNNLFEQFKHFINSYFPLCSQYCKNNFEDTTNEFLKLSQLDSLYEGCDYFDYIKQLLQLENVSQFLEYSNSFLFCAQLPKLFKIFTRKTGQIIIKTPNYCLQESEQLEYQQLLNQRELKINEELQDQKQFAIFYCYLSIQNQKFFFFPKYPQTLQKFLEKTQPEIIQKNQYRFAYQLAQQLNKLHQKQILHRDLKPQNIFLTSEDPFKANIKIADFDRSRKYDDQEEVNQNISIYSSTQDFDPPECGSPNFTYCSDIWQLGLVQIVFIMANYGNYPIEKNGLALTEENYDQFTLDYIENTLKDKNSNQNYTLLISQCLCKDPTMRIHLKKLISEINNIRIQNNEEDSALDDIDSFNDQSTDLLTKSIDWSEFYSSSNKSPTWKLSELRQNRGDTFSFSFIE